MARVLCLLVLVNCCAMMGAIQDYCSFNTFPLEDTSMQFTKEASFEEFALEGTFKGLHCCAKGYRSIEWYKDGKPYPWPLMVSKLILYPESANQTVYVQEVRQEDAGNYTCLLKNDTVVHSHTIQLQIFEKIPDDPKTTYISPNTQVKLGQRLRLFCEAFGGRVDLPDAYNDAVWRKSGPNTTLDEKRIKQIKESREDNQTFGTYLVFENVKKEDFGEYVCKISKPGKSIKHYVYISEKVEVEYLNPNPIPTTKLLLWLSAIILISLTCGVLNFQYGLPLRVRFKDLFGSYEDGKSNDVLILYSNKDSELALGLLLPSLEKKCGYSCSAKELPFNINMWFGSVQQEAAKSRRVIALLSPGALNDTWETPILYQAMKQLLALDSKTIFVALKELPRAVNEAKNAQGETFESLAKERQVLQWDRTNETRFWLKLRLRLPPMRRFDGTAASRLTTMNSSEQSFSNFV